MLKQKMKQLGQGMTEYIIIVALIAVAAIAIYGIFGDTIRQQMGIMTQELAGTKNAANIKDNVKASMTKARGLKDFSAGTK